MPSIHESWAKSQLRYLFGETLRIHGISDATYGDRIGHDMTEGVDNNANQRVTAANARRDGHRRNKDPFRPRQGQRLRHDFVPQLLTGTRAGAHHSHRSAARSRNRGKANCVRREPNPVESSHIQNIHRAVAITYADSAKFVTA